MSRSRRSKGGFAGVTSKPRVSYFFPVGSREKIWLLWVTVAYRGLPITLKLIDFEGVRRRFQSDLVGRVGLVRRCRTIIFRFAFFTVEMLRRSNLAHKGQSLGTFGAGIQGRITFLDRLVREL